MIGKIASVAMLASFAAAAQPVVLQHVRLIDGTGKPAVEDASIVVENGHIAQVGPAASTKAPQGARVIDGSGKTVMPGIIVSHGHVGVTLDGQNRPDAYTRENVLKQLAQYERYGVTAVLALGLNRDLGYDLRDEQRRGGIPGASLFVAGRGIGVPGGAPPLPLAPDQVYRPKTPEEAVKDVQETAAHHADMLKIWVDDIFGKLPKLQRDVYTAAIDEAHRQKLRVAAHVFYLSDAKALAAAGIDALGHSVRDAHVDDELAAVMKKKGIFYIPTLTVDESSYVFAENPAFLQDTFLTDALPEKQVEGLRDAGYPKKVAADANLARNKAAFANGLYNIKALHDAGVKIAFGTDSGGNPVRIQGWGEHRELELLVRAGLTPMDAIVSATAGSAAFLRTADRGTLEAGKRADFIVLEANPLDDIRNTRKLVSVWHDGHENTAVAKSRSSAVAASEVSGVLKKVDAGARSLQISSAAGVAQDVKLAETATITRDGARAGLEQLKEGDDVRASFDASSKQAVRLEVRSAEKKGK